MYTIYCNLWGRGQIDADQHTDLLDIAGLLELGYRNKINNEPCRLIIEAHDVIKEWYRLLISEASAGKPLTPLWKYRAATLTYLTHAETLCSSGLFSEIVILDGRGEQLTARVPESSVYFAMNWETFESLQDDMLWPEQLRIQPYFSLEELCDIYKQQNNIFFLNTLKELQ